MTEHTCTPETCPDSGCLACCFADPANWHPIDLNHPPRVTTDDNPHQCLMPRCVWEASQRGMCEHHYRMAYPDERIMPLIRMHMARENVMHPYNTELAKKRHQRKQRRMRIEKERHD